MVQKHCQLKGWSKTTVNLLGGPKRGGPKTLSTSGVVKNHCQLNRWSKKGWLHEENPCCGSERDTVSLGEGAESEDKVNLRGIFVPEAPTLAAKSSRQKSI